MKKNLGQKFSDLWLTQRLISHRETETLVGHFQDSAIRSYLGMEIVILSDSPFRISGRVILVAATEVVPPTGKLRIICKHLK